MVLLICDRRFRYGPCIHNLYGCTIYSGIITTIRFSGDAQCWAMYEQRSDVDPAMLTRIIMLIIITHYFSDKKYITECMTDKGLRNTTSIK